MYLNLYNAIKEDNLQAFSSLVVKNENICFGRFPLLTLCYLYNSKKILKKFSKQLLNIKNYKVVEEYYQIYKDFKTKAGRTLRLYTKENCTVNPIEMLAILGRDRQVKKLFKILTIHPNNVDKIKKIYYIQGKDFSKNNKKIKITPALMTKLQTKQHKVALIVSLASTVLLSCILIVFNFISGFGVSFSPSKIFSQNQLYNALNLGGSYNLQNDIVIDDYFSVNNFSGFLNGNNHTIFISSKVDTAFIKNNSGSIKNLNFVYQDIQKEISSSVSLFVGENLGDIENVNITCSKLDLDVFKSTENDIFINGLANTNKGTIKNCNVKFNAEINTTQDGECFVSGVVGKNFGKVLDSNVLENSTISSLDADLSGIVSINEVDAVVENCKNNATITQTSQTEGWSPNVSGIVLTNHGKINKCFNLGNLYIYANANRITKSGFVFLGGISSMNHGVIEKSLNKADLTANSKDITIYCGGISAYSGLAENSTKAPSIKNCGVQGKIDVVKQSESTYAYIGGISGYMYGEVLSNYSLASFAQSYSENKLFVGLCLGSAFTNDGKFLALSVNKNIVLAQPSTECQIASFIFLNKPFAAQLNAENGEILTLNTIQEITAHEVYWNE